MSNAVLDETKNVKTFSVNLPIEIHDNFTDLDEETLADIAECEDILAHPEKYKGYDSVDEMFKDIGVSW